jgi:predicted nucleic acid-binding protein
MEYVIDFNILFSSLLSGKSFYKLLFQQYRFYVPDFIFIELQKYEDTILSNTKLEIKQLQIYAKFLFSQLTAQPSLILSSENKQKAYDLCKDIDLKDMTYIALAIELNIPLITRDEELYKGLIKKKFNQVILFQDFIN